MNRRSWAFILLFMAFMHGPSEAEIEYLGSTGGTITDFVIYPDPASGKTYAYVAQGTGIVVLDVTDLKNPIAINRINPSSDLVYRLTLSQSRLVVTNGIGGTVVYSLVSPEHPDYLFSVPGYPVEAWLGGTVLYTRDIPESSYGGGSGRLVYSVKKIDVSIPTKPVELQSMGYFAYNVFSVPSLLAVDQSDPNKPLFYERVSNRLLRSDLQKPLLIDETQADLPIGVVLFAKKVYVTSTKALRVYESLPDGLLQSATVFVGTLSSPALVDGRHLYLPTGSHLFEYDLSDPDAPSRTDEIPISFPIKTVANGIAYAQSNSFEILASPLHGPDRGRTFVIQGNSFPLHQIDVDKDLILARSFRLINPYGPYEETYHLLRYRDGKMEYESRLDVPNQLPHHDRVKPFWIRDRLAMVGTTDGIQIFDAADPRNPKKAGIIPRWTTDTISGSIETLFLHQEQGYFHINEYNANTRQGSWYIYSVQDPYQPVLVKQLPFDPNMDADISAYHGGIFYYCPISYHSNEVHAQLLRYDFTDPLNPTQLSPIDLPPHPYYRLTVSDNALVLISHTSNGSRIEVYNPIHHDKLELKMEFDTPFSYAVQSSALEGPFLWLNQDQIHNLLSFSATQLIRYNLGSSTLESERFNLGTQNLQNYKQILSADGNLFFPGDDRGLQVFRATSGNAVSSWRGIAP